MAKTRCFNKFSTCFHIYAADEFIAAITQHIPEKSFQTCTELAEVWCVIMAGIQTNLADYAKNRAISNQAINRLMKLMKLSR